MTTPPPQPDPPTPAEPGHTASRAVPEPESSAAEPQNRTAGADPRRFWLAYAALLGAATLWSLNGMLIKLLSGVGDTLPELPAITIAFYRSLFGGLIFLPLAWRARGTLRAVHPAWIVGGILTFTLMTAAFVTANTMTAAANAIILQYTSPVWVFLLAPLLLAERPAWRDGAVLLLAMVGVGVIFFGHPLTETTPLLVALASGLGYGALTVMLRGLRPIAPEVVVGLNFLGSALLLAPAVLIWGVFGASPLQFAVLVGMSVIQMALPYWLFSWALRVIPSHRAALLVLLETVLNPLWTYLVIGEAVPVPTLIGGPIILLSVALWTWLSWRHGRSARRDLRAGGTPTELT